MSDEAPGPARVPVLAANQQTYTHSHVFDELITGPEDLPGLVAYGLYKLRKRQWIKDFEQTKGCQPTPAQCLDYSFGFRDNALGALRDEAEGTLFRFSENMIDSRKPELMNEAFNQRAVSEIADLKTRIASDIADLKGQLRKVSGYRHHIVGHVAGFVVLVALVFIFTVGIKYEPHLATMFSG